MADKEQKTEESKKVLEREYIVPLRSEWLKVQKYKRANKAVKALKEFIARHMKIYDRDLRKVRVDIYLNNELRFRGMRKPPAKVKVKAIKYEDGTVSVKLAELPKHIEFELARKVRKEAESLKKAEDAKKKEAEEKKEEKPESAEEKKDIKEKETSSKEATQAIEKAKAQEAKHTSGVKKEPVIQRKTLKK